jgi:phosphatidylserine/phosphatidylglycerophosphate/cardiolipin synthase-like enzyme
VISLPGFRRCERATASRSWSTVRRCCLGSRTPSRGAESYVHLAGWAFAPEFRLRPDGPGLRDVLAEVAERVDVRLIAWAGSPLPLFRPDRVAFVGGIDLTDFSGQRFDSHEHPQRDEPGWHDAAGRIEGPAVVDVAEHFRLRWHEVTGETLPPSAPQPRCGDVDVQVVRTVPEKIYKGLPRGDFGILEAYLRALRSAERFVYLENQFLWSPEVVAVLAEKLRRPPCDDFRLLVLLPAKPSSGGDNTRGQLGLLLRADDGAGRMLACTVYQRGGTVATPVYVHAKIGIVDDRWLTIGSANLNEHSLFNDTELNLVVEDGRMAREVRLRLWSEHLGLRADDIPANPAEAFDTLWKPIADEQLRRREQGLPPTHHLARLPHVSRRSASLLGPLSGLIVDG